MSPPWYVFCGELIIPKGEHFWLFFYFCNLHHYKDVITKTKDGKNIIKQLNENEKAIFRMDVGKNAHRMEMYGYKDPVNHINIEIQTKSSAGKYKTKWNYHIILDNEGDVTNNFKTGVWSKK